MTWLVRTVLYSILPEQVSATGAVTVPPFTDPKVDVARTKRRSYLLALIALIVAFRRGSQTVYVCKKIPQVAQKLLRTVTFANR